VQIIEIINVFPHGLQLKGFSVAAAASDGFHQILNISVTVC